MKGLQRIRLGRRSDRPAPQETQPTVAGPVPHEPSQPLPAGVAPQDVVPARPSFRDRGRLRRRLRYLRRVRELGFRDLGGLVFDLHRFGHRRDELVLGKLHALDAVDRELRALERVLDERRDIIELREPGIAGCPRCGVLHGSDARFCPQCGTQFGGATPIGDVTPTAPAGAPAPQPAPAGEPRTSVQPTAPVPPPGPAPAAPQAPIPNGAASHAPAQGDQPTAPMHPVGPGRADTAPVPGGDPLRRDPAGDQRR
jgi:hypothetical protein